MFENVNIDWNLSHDDGSTDFSDEETLEDHPRTLNRTPDKKGSRPMSIFTPTTLGESEELSPGHNRSHGSTSDWSRSNTSDSGDSPGSYRNSVMPPPPPPQSKKPSICKFLTIFITQHQNIFLSKKSYLHPVVMIHCPGVFHFVLWLVRIYSCILTNVFVEILVTAMAGYFSVIY